jgi:thiamine biosynthesis protein ThiI
MHYIVRLFPEITIKSTPVRKRFTRQVRDNLAKQLRRLDDSIEVRRDWEKIDIWLADGSQHLREQVETVLGTTPGVAKFSRVRSYPLVDFDEMLARLLPLWQGRLAGKTFCVRVRRTGDHDFSSMAVERFLGAGLMALGEAAGVRLKNPDLVVAVEIRDAEYHLVEQTLPGLGGFPLGSQGGALSLISGGFDSTVASYLTIKRGLLTHFCFFNLGGRAHELGVKEAAYYLWQKYGSSHRVKFVTVPFDGVVAEILTRVSDAYMGVVLKRMMYRAASRVAEGLELDALVTGESVAQVASQTLVNLRVIDEVTDLLTLRPLSVMDKGDIIDISRAIGTEAIAAAMPEYCGVISVRPTTRAKRDRVVAAEERFDMAVLDRAVAARVEENIDCLEMDSAASTGVETYTLPLPDAVILDIRHPDEVQHRVLRAGSAAVVAIPFFELAKAAAGLDPQRTYLLYCERGVMSRLHAELLRDQGYTNIGVYRPGS